jgi:hypothetical protein
MLRAVFLRVRRADRLRIGARGEQVQQVRFAHNIPK